MSAVHPLVNMGPHLRGLSPPFTPSGRAATAASSVSFADRDGTPTRQSGHQGILVRWRAPAGAAESLLPAPLEPIESTATPWLFLNETQTGQGREFILNENPQLVNWHEALFLIPCSFEGTRAAFVWALYKDVDYDAGIALGIYRGFVNKAARFSALFPFPGQPLNREMAPGQVATISASRMGERILTCSFRADRELTAEEIEREIERDELLNCVGIRYMPDWTSRDAAPLVHDLVMWGMTAGGIPRAWAGDAELRFGDSDAEELDLLQPVEMLPSHFIFLQYRGGPGVVRVLHDYVERRADGGRTVRTRKGDMGPHLRGGSPPFTPSGRAAYVRSTDFGAGELGQSGHVGLLMRFRVDRESAEQLLPRPLEPSPTTDRPLVFLNRTQSGLNRHRPAGEEGLGFLARLNPNHATWHEALFLLPCLCEGEPAAYVPMLYKDQDHGVPLGMFDGFWTKLATFHATFPFPPQPLNSELEPGGVVRFNVSRFDERIITAVLEAERELTPEEIGSELDLRELATVVGVRFWPDYARPGEPPLAHDLVRWRMASAEIPRAWAGSGTLAFGDSDYEELHLLEPLEVLPSYFVYLQYRAGAGIGDVVHDYVREEIR